MVLIHRLNKGEPKRLRESVHQWDIMSDLETKWKALNLLPCIIWVMHTDLPSKVDYCGMMIMIVGPILHGGGYAKCVSQS